jgi:hypothetical protein
LSVDAAFAVVGVAAARSASERHARGRGEQHGDEQSSIHDCLQTISLRAAITSVKMVSAASSAHVRVVDATTTALSFDDVTVQVSIDRGARIVRSTFGGTLTIVDFLEGRARVEKHPDFSPSFAHVLDFTAVTAVDIESQTMRDLAAMPSIFERGAIQVVVAPSRSLVSHLAQMFQAIRTGRDVRVVQTFDEATASLLSHRN